MRIGIVMAPAPQAPHPESIAPVLGVVARKAVQWAVHVAVQ